MRITIHGHRPAFLRPQTAAGAAQPGDAASVPATSPATAAETSASSAPDQTVRNVNLGFFKLKIHRQTPLQSALVNQLAQRPADNAATPSDAPPSDALPRRPSESSLNDSSLSANSSAAGGRQRPNAPEADALALSTHSDASSFTAPPPSESSHSRTASNASDISLGSFVAATRSTATAQPAALSRDEYIAHWNAWAEQGDIAGRENRPEAVNRMTRWLDAHSTNQFPPALDLSMLRLRRLPEHLPPGVEDLRLYDNRLIAPPEHLPPTLKSLDLTLCRQLDRLPDNLPAGLRSLHAEQCFYRRLPDNLPAGLENLNVAEGWLERLPDNLPAGLQTLNVGLNHNLTELPENLPDTLELLFAESCRLTHLPERLPAALQELDARDNRLTRLPESLTAQRENDCRIDLANNPLPERVRNRLAEVLNAPGYSGPRVRFSMHNPQEAAVRPGAEPVRTMQQAVTSWMALTGADAATTVRQWSGFSDEPGATAFTQFLDRLRGTVNFRNRLFQAGVAEWLTHLAAHPTLRQSTFAVSQGATTSCEDRVSLTFNAMRQLRLAHDVEQGQYDDRLPELLTLARGMFRLDQLEGIAREKTASLNYVDEIEVYLAYQVKLRESLELPLDTPDMRFFNVSYVTQADLDRAEARVLAAEQQGFADHLSTNWQPWQSVLQRLAPERHAQAQEELMEAMGDEFTTRLQSRLQEMGLENDADAQRTLGPQVQAEIAREINGRLTQEFLASQGLLDHMAPPAANRPPEH